MASAMVKGDPFPPNQVGMNVVSLSMENAHKELMR